MDGVWGGGKCLCMQASRLSGSLHSVQAWMESHTRRETCKTDESADSRHVARRDGCLSEEGKLSNIL